MLYESNDYISCGILTTLIIEREDFCNTDFLRPRIDYTKDIRKQKNKILSELNKTIDISMYNIRYNRDCIELSIKPDIFNDNIYDLLNELSPIFDIKSYLVRDRIDYYTLDYFNINDFPIILKKYELGRFKDSFYIQTKDDEYKEVKAYSDFTSFLIPNEDIKNIKMQARLIMIWMDNSETAEYLFRTFKLLNHFCRNYYKNNLVKSLMFFEYREMAQDI